MAQGDDDDDTHTPNGDIDVTMAGEDGSASVAVSLASSSSEPSLAYFKHVGEQIQVKELVPKPNPPHHPDANPGLLSNASTVEE